MTISDPLEAWTRSAKETASLRRTKIVATLGPSTDGRLDALIAAGLDCARLNCSHGTSDDLIRRSAELRAAASESRTSCRRDVRPPRTEDPPRRGHRSTHPPNRRAGAADRSRRRHRTRPARVLTVAYDRFCELLTERSEIVIGDGTPRLQVMSVDGAHRDRSCERSRDGERPQRGQRHARPHERRRRSPRRTSSTLAGRQMRR